MTHPKRTSQRAKSADLSLIEADKRNLIDGLERERRRKIVTPLPVVPSHLAFDPVFERDEEIASLSSGLADTAPVSFDPAAAQAKVNEYDDMDSQALKDEVVRLREELRLSYATNALLENELYLLEHKALDAIAEAGMLRQKLSVREQEMMAESQEHTIDQIDDMKEELQAYREDAGLLTRALLDSESEVSKLLQNMDLFTRRFCVME